MTRRRGMLALLAALCLWLTALAGPVAGADVTFGVPTATSTWGQGIEFRQPAGLPSGVRRVELLVELARAAGPSVRVVPSSGGTTTLRYFLDTAGGGMLPNTAMTARWRVIGQDGTSSLGPSVSVRYDDTRFSWQAREDSLVHVHWYEGASGFGDRALQLGTDAITKAGRLLGVTETEPVDFFVYATQDAFYGALGPGTRENVGGQADANIRTLFALITPGEINASWVGIVIPHELTHLVFDTAVRNPYHFPPRWLNEGLAVYLSEGYQASDRAAVARAVAAGTLMPLSALVGQFPTTADRFSLAYSESVAAVDYLVRQQGEAALVGLIRSYAHGVTNDEAFNAAVGLSAGAFDAAWRSSLNAREPVAYGPKPAPSGPLPADWAAGDPAGPGGTSIPGSGADGGAPLPLLLLAGAGLAVAASLILVARIRRRRGGTDA